MEVTITVPDEIIEQIEPNGGDAGRKLLEMAALEGYKSGELTAYQVQLMLGFDNRIEVDGFLKAHSVSQEYTLEDLESGRASLDALLSK